MRNVFFGLLIPFIGTTLGALMVLFVSGSVNQKLQKVLLGFASGVMIAASVWSLLIPSIEMAEAQNIIAWVPASLGFLFGMFFLLLLDHIIPHLHINNVVEGPKTNLKKNTMLVLAVTLHNIPEGMAVGVIFAGLLSGVTSITVSGAFALSLGIAIQNFPEGAIISMPLAADGTSKWKACWMGIGSGVVEPIAGFLTVLITRQIMEVLPYFLAFAAGAMIYVVVDELIPGGQSGKHTDLTTVGVAFGFVLMMILDVALG
ncbi:MAG: ZIP family metal transporter [Sphaerochaetaceae bacterium]|nr:ZIP family metal transporter [Sphaerochaetaceae bacterium]